tara:strand:- start:1467 stop:1853 length:387 start_codon:yes stop_codon:yes gene_type:complete
MEIDTTPIIYAPKMDLETRLYSDQPIFNFKNGISCPCTEGKVFYKRCYFISHQKCKRHICWIQNLNDNATNYYQKTLEQEKTIKCQQTLLSKLQIQLNQKETIIEYYENKNSVRNTVTNEIDLLNFID